jgi:hypothetical protein
LELCVGRRQRGDLLLQVYFSFAAFADFILELFVDGCQLGSLLLETRLNLPVYGNFVLKLPNLLL